MPATIIAIILNTALGIAIAEQFGWFTWCIFLATWCPATGLAVGLLDGRNLRR